MHRVLLLACLAALVSCASTPPDQRVRIMAYNVKHGRGMDGRVDLERVAAVIDREKPDIVTLQEIDERCRRSGSVDEAETLARLTGLHHHAFGPFMDYDGGRYGMAVLSRWPILSVENHRLPDGAEPRTALTFRVKPTGWRDELVVSGIHFYATRAQRLAQARRLNEYLADVESPVVLAGDFNSRPDDPVMQGYGAPWRVLAKDGPRFTFPSDEPDREIDYLVVRPADRFSVERHVVIAEKLASDHRPIVADLVIR